MSGTLTHMQLAGVGGILRISSDDSSSVSRRFVRPPITSSVNQCKTSVKASTATVSVIDSRRPANLYEILRIEQNASAVEIKLAYRRLAKVYHPDSAARRSEFDERNFIEIHEAYETLSDPSARAIYDLSLTTAHGGRRPSTASVVSNGNSSGFYQTRSWETDQCW